VSYTGHASSPHPASGQWKREPGTKTIMMCSSRLPSSPSRNSTPDTLHGSGNCKAAVNNEVVSMTTKLADRHHRQSAFTHTKQRKAINFNPRSLRGATVGISEYAVSLFGGVLNALTMIPAQVLYLLECIF